MKANHQTIFNQYAAFLQERHKLREMSGISCQGCLFYKNDTDECIAFFPVRVANPLSNVDSCPYWERR